ncbi:hypothetical protein HYW11_03185, partial [Candidatus Peregrinibacteria bacterium]|nr:hypothetical protein [Candidatus Peregrinibacteria bacterium]
RFVEQVGRLLEGQLGRPVTVRALGIGAAEPARELLYYRHLGRAFHPDIVVQVLFPENDLLSMTGSYRFARDVGGELSVEEVWVDPPLPCSWKCQFLRHSELAVQTYRILRRLRETPFADPLLGDFGVYTEAGQQALAREGRFTATAAIVSALRDDVERDHGRFLAVLMPGAFEIHAVWREEIERRYTETDSTVWWPSRVVDLFRDALRKRDIAVVDLRPPFLEYETVHPDAFLYHRLDPHLNPTGHAITASALADRLSPLFSP